MVLPAPTSGNSSSPFYSIGKSAASKTTGTIAYLTGNISGGSSYLCWQFYATTTSDFSTGFELSGDNTFTAGQVYMEHGRLYITNPNSAGNPTNTLYTRNTANTTAGTVVFTTGMTFANPIVFVGGSDPCFNASGYTVTLTGNISGGASGDIFSQVGTGTLVLTGTNTYVDVTEVIGGVLSVGADANLGAFPVQRQRAVSSSTAVRCWRQITSRSTATAASPWGQPAAPAPARLTWPPVRR